VSVYPYFNIMNKPVYILWMINPGGVKYFQGVYSTKAKANKARIQICKEVPSYKGMMDFSIREVEIDSYDFNL
jgi:hypothetical protein